MNTIITINMNNAALGTLGQQAHSQRSERATRHLGTLEASTTVNRTPSTTSAKRTREHTEPTPIQLIKAIKMV